MISFYCEKSLNVLIGTCSDKNMSNLRRLPEQVGHAMETYKVCFHGQVLTMDIEHVNSEPFRQHIAVSDLGFSGF